MAEILIPNVTHLVAKMTYGAEIWTNSIHVLNVAGGSLSDTASAVVAFKTAEVSSVPTAGFLESITAYETFQTHVGDTILPHSPLWVNEYHLAGSQDTFFGDHSAAKWLPKDVVVFQKLATSGGRSGKMFLRNLLTEEDVVSTASGQWQFDATTTLFTAARYNTVWPNTFATIMVGGDDYASERLVVVHLGHVPTGDPRAAFTTPVSAMTRVRPTWNDAHR